MCPHVFSYAFFISTSVLFFFLPDEVVFLSNIFSLQSLLRLYSLFLSTLHHCFSYVFTFFSFFKIRISLAIIFSFQHFYSFPLKSLKCFLFSQNFLKMFYPSSYYFDAQKYSLIFPSLASSSFPSHFLFLSHFPHFIDFFFIFLSFYQIAFKCK